MSFQYSAIGDNTPENREHLEKLGYRKYMWVSTDNEEPFISTIAHSSEYMAFDNDSLESSALRDDINCIGNPQLFKAVTAITTTTDIGKYYINIHTGQWRKCDLDMATDYYIEWDDWTEASIAELQAHFQRV